MKILKYAIVLGTVPLALGAVLQDDLVRFKKSLLMLSQLLDSAKPPMPTPPPKKPAVAYIPNGRPTEFSDIQQWLLDAVSIYKNNPFDFAEHIQESELKTLKDMLIAYFTQEAQKAEDDEQDLQFEPDILDFVRIVLEQKQVGGSVIASQYKTLSSSIDKNYYDNVKKYAKDYIGAITKEDFAKGLSDLQAKVRVLVTQIPNLQGKNPTDLVTVYHEMQQVIKSAAILMLPITTGDIKKVQDEVQKLQSDFKQIMQGVQQNLTQKYSALQDDSEIKKIQQEYAQSKSLAQKGKDPQTALQALEISTKNKIDQRMNSLVYKDYLLNKSDFNKMLHDCQNVEAIVQATSKDVQKLTAQREPEAMCSYIQNIALIDEFNAKLVTWSSVATINSYSKENAQAAYVEITDFVVRIKKILGAVPAGTKKSIDQALAVVLGRLSFFKDEYENNIKDQKDAIARAIGAAKPEYNDVMAASGVMVSCNIINAIYNHQKTPMDKDILNLCTAVNDIVRAQGSPESK